MENIQTEKCQIILKENKSKAITENLGCARFPELLHNFSEHQILWRMCSVVFHALTLRLFLQTSLSVYVHVKNVKILVKQAHPRIEIDIYLFDFSLISVDSSAETSHDSFVILTGQLMNPFLK